MSKTADELTPDELEIIRLKNEVAQLERRLAPSVKPDLTADDNFEHVGLTTLDDGS